MGKIYKDKGTESISRNLIFDNELSDRARFVYCFMMAKPNDWDFYVKSMSKELGYSEETLHKYINELIRRGWLTKVGQSRDENNKFGAVDYIIHETRQENIQTSLFDNENFSDGKISTRKKAVTEKSRDGKFTPQKDNIDKIEIQYMERNKERRDIASIIIDAETPESVKEIPQKRKKDGEPKVYSLQYRCQSYFLQEYEKYKGSPYRFNKVDAANLKGIIDGLMYMQKKEQQPCDDDSIEVAFQIFINSLICIKPDKWIDAHFSIPNINSKFNEIYAQLKNGTSRQQPNNGSDPNCRITRDWLEQRMREAAGID